MHLALTFEGSQINGDSTHSILFLLVLEAATQSTGLLLLSSEVLALGCPDSKTTVVCRALEEMPDKSSSFITYAKRSLVIRCSSSDRKGSFIKLSKYSLVSIGSFGRCAGNVRETCQQSKAKAKSQEEFLLRNPPAEPPARMVIGLILGAIFKLYRKSDQPTLLHIWAV